MKNKIIAAILLMGILWNGQMVYAEDTAVGEVIATESENSESTNAETTEMELERESESQGVVSTESAVTVISEAAVLMEAGTGTVIYEKNQDVRVIPASITKIMTLLLIYDALYNGKIQLTDEVVTSARAKSMGGSQVFLEEGEKQTVETLIKCIVIASGNDASVAMAEYVSGSEEAVVESRHLGLKTAEEVSGLQEKIERLAEAVSATLDWERLLALTSLPAPVSPLPDFLTPASPTVRIAVAKDEAFCFTYAETLDALRAAGAELVFFSPLHDTALPEGIGGVYLPGGYPELHAKALRENEPLRCALCAAIQRGLPTVAECGGFLYLGQSLEDADGTAYPMAGVLPGQGFRVGKLVRFGYAALTAQADSMLFRCGEALPVHEFHHWDTTANGDAFTARKADGRSWPCGFANEHFYAGFPHLYWAGTALPRRFVDAAAHYHQEEQDQ